MVIILIHSNIENKGGLVHTVSFLSFLTIFFFHVNVTVMSDVLGKLSDKYKRHKEYIFNQKSH